MNGALSALWVQQESWTHNLGWREGKPKDFLEEVIWEESGKDDLKGKSEAKGRA